jgi:hypothetical protein
MLEMLTPAKETQTEMTMIQERAVATSWFLIDAMDAMVPQLWSDFQEECADVIGYSAPELTSDRFRRLLVELLAWSLYRLREESIPSRITRRTILLKKVADEETGDCFFQLVLNDMHHYLSPYLRGMGDLEVMNFHPFEVGYGAQLSLQERVTQYLHAPSVKMAKEQFLQHLALNLDPTVMAHGKTFAMQQFERLATEADTILEHVLNHKHPVEAIESILSTQAQPVAEEGKAILEGLQLPQFQVQFARA